MDTAETIARASVWIALIAYPAGLLGLAVWPTHVERGLRAVWTLGALFFLTHAISSFAAFYGWSHTVAMAETARQTAEMTGSASDVGLWLNYVFTALWLLDAAWWHVDPTSYRSRSSRIDLALHAFFLFMIVNGAVVFVEGPRRWAGATVLLLSGCAAWTAWRRHQAVGSTTPSPSA